MENFKQPILKENANENEQKNFDQSFLRKKRKRKRKTKHWKAFNCSYGWFFINSCVLGDVKERMNFIILILLLSSKKTVNLFPKFSFYFSGIQFKVQSSPTMENDVVKEKFIWELFFFNLCRKYFSLISIITFKIFHSEFKKFGFPLFRVLLFLIFLVSNKIILTFFYFWDL